MALRIFTSTVTVFISSTHNAPLFTPQAALPSYTGKLSMTFHSKKGLFKRFILAMATLACLFISTSASAKDWVYTVKPGDTLWDLCLTYTTHKTCWLEVGKYNGVGYPPSLAPGTRIRFPVPWLKAQPAPASLIYAAGNVQIIASGLPARAAVVGDILPMGAQVKTLEGSSATVQFADGATLVLEPQSHVVMDLLTRHEQTGMVNTRLNLLSGAAKSRVPKRKPRSQFSVSTPSAIAAVRGTDFRVSADAGQMRSEVFEGNIEVANPPKSSKVQRVELAENFGLRVEAGKPLGQPVALLAAVEWMDDVVDITLPYTLTWQVLPLAKRYKVELLAPSEAEEIMASDYVLEATWVLPLQQAQCFTARVSAIDALGLQGMPAERKLCAAEPLPPAQALNIERKQLQWQPVPNAVGYRVEFSEDAAFMTPMLAVTTEMMALPLTPEHKGLYARVTALDDKQRLGEASPPIEVKWQNTEGIIATVLFFLLLAL